MQFQYFLAYQLKKTVAEIDEMDAVEYMRWSFFFKNKLAAEKRATDEARRAAGGRRR